MWKSNRSNAVAVLGVLFGLLLIVAVGACGGAKEETQVSAPAAPVVNAGKIEISTASDEARDLYMQGRDLAEKLRAADSREYFEKAVALDPNFALAHLALANTAPTNKEFFASLDTAAGLTADVSEGERWMIHAVEAGVKGEPEKQGELLGKLVHAYPNDERARNLSGGYHFGRQEYEQAVTEYSAAIEIDPDFSQPYNQLGYAQRFLGEYEAAEETFKKYTEIIPDEPNPYDSYAELLMKIGRFDESIENYEKALAVNPNFVASYIGIANNQMFMGEGDEARATLGKLADQARNTGESRQANFWTAVSYIHEGDFDQAIGSCKKMYALSEAEGDLSAMAGDMNLMGNMLLESGNPEKALAKYTAGVELIDQADVMDQVKENTHRNFLFQEARVAIAMDDMETAHAKIAVYGEAVAEKQIPFEIRQHHELLGMMALMHEDYDQAVAEFAQAGNQNPRVLYKLAKAYKGAGDKESALDLAGQAADFNALNVNFGYVRSSAQKLVKKLSS